LFLTQSLKFGGGQGGRSFEAVKITLLYKCKIKKLHTPIKLYNIIFPISTPTALGTPCLGSSESQGGAFCL
jgi:hypothetical protein